MVDPATPGDKQAEVILVGCGCPLRGMGWYHAVQMIGKECPSAALCHVVEPWFLGGGTYMLLADLTDVPSSFRIEGFLSQTNWTRIGAFVASSTPVLLSRCHKLYIIFIFNDFVLKVLPALADLNLRNGRRKLKPRLASSSISRSVTCPQLLTE